MLTRPLAWRDPEYQSKSAYDVLLKLEWPVRPLVPSLEPLRRRPVRFDQGPMLKSWARPTSAVDEIAILMLPADVFGGWAVLRSLQSPRLQVSWGIFVSSAHSHQALEKHRPTSVPFRSAPSRRLVAVRPPAALGKPADYDSITPWWTPRAVSRLPAVMPGCPLDSSKVVDALALVELSGEALTF